MNKEQILLAAVVVVTGAVYGMDSKYRPVPIPATTPPTGMPAVPEVPPPPAAFGGQAPVRSLLDEFSDLLEPPLKEFAQPPAPPVPVAVPPVRPFPAPWSGTILRHDFPDVEEAASSAPAASTEGAPPAAASPPKKGDPVDLAKFDRIVNEGMSNITYGVIELFPADAAKGPFAKYRLLVDEAMDFNFAQIDQNTGRVMFRTKDGYRARTKKIEFSDTIENHFWSEAWRRGLANEKGLLSTDEAGLLRLAAWIAEKSDGPKYDRLKGLELAARAYRDALRMHADPNTVKDLGRVLRRSYELDQETALYNWYLAKQAIAPDPEILALRGETYEELGLRGPAGKDYETSLAARQDPRVRLRLAQVLLSSDASDEIRRAKEAFDTAASQATTGEIRVAAALGAAHALLALGDVAGADAALERLSTVERGAAWFVAKGAVLYSSKRPDLEKARDHFEGALAKSPGDPVARTNLAIVLARLAVQAADPNDRKALLDKALATAEQALADDPLNYYWPLVAKAYALRAEGKREDAVAVLQEAVAALPAEPYGRYLLGTFYLRDGRAAEARTQFLESARLSPAFPDALAGVGLAGGGAGGEAMAYLRRAAKLEPGNALWRYQAARVALADEGVPQGQRLEEARKDLAEIVEKVDRSYAPALVLLGYVRYYQGNADEALDRWNRAMTLISPVTLLNRPLADWISDVREKVDKWMSTRIWRDEFKRPDAPSIGNGWKEDEKQGVKITLAGEGVLFAGRSVKDDSPAVSRDWPSKQVLEATAWATVGQGAQCDVFVEFVILGGSRELAFVGLCRKENNTVVLRIKPDQRTPDAEIEQPIDFKWPENGGPVKFRFTRVLEGADKDKAREATRLNLYLDDTLVKTIDDAPGFALGRGGGNSLRIRMKCMAGGGTAYEARMEGVEVWLDTRAK